MYKRILVLQNNNIYYIIFDIGWVPMFPNTFSHRTEYGKVIFHLQKTTKKYGLYLYEV